jgi:transcription factor Pcc1
LKAVAVLELDLKNAKVGDSLAAVLAPDNEGIPKGLKVSMEAEGSVMTFRVRAESASTALSTVLAILRDVSLFQEVWLLSHGKDARTTRTEEP